MTDLDLFGVLFDWLMVYGPLILGLATLLGALGLPLPTPLLVVAAGALTRQGSMDWQWVVLACIAGSALGESLYYAAGRYAAAWMRRRADRLLSSVWAAAQERFHGREASAIWLTRFLLTPLAIPTCLVAGSSRYAYPRFLAYAAIGDMMWIAPYAAAGFILGDRWEVGRQAISTYGGWIGIFALTACALFGLWKVKRASLIHEIPRSRHVGQRPAVPLPGEIRRA